MSITPKLSSSSSSLPPPTPFAILRHEKYYRNNNNCHTPNNNNNVVIPKTNGVCSVLFLNVGCDKSEEEEMEEGDGDDIDDDSSSSSSSSIPHFRCGSSSFQPQQQHQQQYHTPSHSYDGNIPQSLLLLSSHTDGTVLLWDVGGERRSKYGMKGSNQGQRGMDMEPSILHLPVTTTNNNNNICRDSGDGMRNINEKERIGPGLALGRIGGNNDIYNDNGNYFWYQSRDSNGTITIHDPNTITTTDTCSSSSSLTTTCSALSTYHTGSTSFCKAASISSTSNDSMGGGYDKLLALPYAFDDDNRNRVGGGGSHRVALRDIRVNPHSRPVAIVRPGSNNNETGGKAERGPSSSPSSSKSGMVTSIALTALPSSLSSKTSSSSTMILACGMESGTLFLHDLRYLSGCFEEKEKHDRNDRKAFHHQQQQHQPHHQHQNQHQYQQQQQQQEQQHKQHQQQQQQQQQQWNTPYFARVVSRSSLSLSVDPILSLDGLVLPSLEQQPSTSVYHNINDNNKNNNVGFVAGCAGGRYLDPGEIKERIFVIDVAVKNDKDKDHDDSIDDMRNIDGNDNFISSSHTLDTHVTAAAATCRIGGTGGSTGVGAVSSLVGPSLSCERRYNSSRKNISYTFAAGGWDGRVRIFSAPSRTVVVNTTNADSITSPETIAITDTIETEKVVNNEMKIAAGGNYPEKIIPTAPTTTATAIIDGAVAARPLAVLRGWWGRGDEAGNKGVLSGGGKTPSVTCLDHYPGRTEIEDIGRGILAAGSDNGVIALWNI